MHDFLCGSWAYCFVSYCILCTASVLCAVLVLVHCSIPAKCCCVVCETSTKSVKHCYYCTLRPVSRNVSPWTDSDGWALWVNISNSDKGYIELHRLELFLPFRYSMGVDPRRPGNSPLPAITWVGGNCGWATVIQYLGPVVYNCRHQGGGAPY